MKQFQVLHLQLLILILLATTSTRAFKYAKPGCRDMCGEVRIPYPFGIGSKCSINKWYVVDCNSSIPYLSAFNNLEVLSVSLEQQTVTVNVSMVADCRNPIRNLTQILHADDGGSPFLISKLNNIFVVEVCGNAVIMNDHGTIVSGCSTTCRNDTVNNNINCYGVGCCQTTIPHYLKSLSLNLTGLEGQGGEKAWGFAYLVDKTKYDEGTFYRQPLNGDFAYVPVSLLWTLTDHDYDESPCCLQSVRRRLILDLGNDASMESVRCECVVTYEGNPYLNGGCKESEECASCQYGHECLNFPVYNGDLKLISNVTCVPKNELKTFGYTGMSFLGYILGISVIIGFVILTVITCVLSGVNKKENAKRLKVRFFKRNGGLLLKQQEAADPGLVNKTILFTFKELEKATQFQQE